MSPCPERATLTPSVDPRDFADYLTLREVSVALCIGYQTAVRLVHSGRLGAIRLSTGKRNIYMVPRAALDDPELRAHAAASAWKGTRSTLKPADQDGRRSAVRTARARSRAAQAAAQKGAVHE